MHPVSTNDEPVLEPEPSPQWRRQLGRGQRALVLQFQALSCLVLFIGLLSGIFVAGGAPVLGSFCLLISLVLLEPLALSYASARDGNYRLASLFGLFGAAAYAILAVVLLGIPLAGLPLLGSIGALFMKLVAAGMLAGGSVATLNAARALWTVPDGPAELGPGAGKHGRKVLPAGPASDALPAVAPHAHCLIGLA
jgi:hypothetical protein